VFFVISDTYQVGAYWCRQNGLNPHSRNVRICTWASDLQGTRFQEGDHLKVVDSLDYRAQRSFCDLLEVLDMNKALY